MSLKAAAIITFVGILCTVLIWGFVAGWAGEIRLLPDGPSSLSEILVFSIIIWWAPALAAFGIWKAIGAVRRGGTLD